MAGLKRDLLVMEGDDTPMINPDPGETSMRIPVSGPPRIKPHNTDEFSLVTDIEFLAHNDETANVHGIVDMLALLTGAEIQIIANEARNQAIAADRPIASQIEAETGLDELASMNSLRVAQAIAALAPKVSELLYIKVDPSFTIDTPGWGVYAFNNISSAQNSIVADGAHIVVNGDCVSAEGDTWIVSYDTTISMTNSGRVYVWGMSDHLIVNVGSTLKIHGGSIHCSSNEIHGTIDLVDVFVESGISMETGSTLRMSGCSGYTYGGVADVLLSGTVDVSITNSVISKLKGYLWVPTTYSFISANYIHWVEELGVDAPFYNNVVWNSWYGNTTIDPLNHSNLIKGVTHKEVVLLSTLPTAGVSGRTAMTSDGGTGGIPAMMGDNGTAWIVVWE